MLKIYNSLSRKVEEFIPLNPPKVGVYTCGPTVYDFQHIGNFRTMIFSDILLRTLMANNFDVKSVRNITDIDDKIIKAAKEKNLGIEEFSSEFTTAFFNDLGKLNILPVDVSPKATEHVTKMVKYIEVLIKKGLAYIEDDGSVYFDISKFPNYGKLSGLEKRQLKTGTRILSDEYSKEDVQDFALWKSISPSEVGYDSPWGRGRPGWHIECSVMSQEYLGETLDIHAGGIDLLFPHHENEIAQSEGYTGKPFANFFVHGEHLLVEGAKMSKSLKNFYKLSDLEDKGFEPLSYRYLVLTAHYRDKLNFTWESLQAAQNALNNLREIVRGWDEPKIGCAEFEQRFMQAINNDLNTPTALAVMWEMIKSDYPASAKAASILKMDKVLGLKFDGYVGKQIEIPDNVKKLVDQRENVRESGDFELSDKLRKEIKGLGYELEDTSKGPRIKKLIT
ncbi:MAG: hypothetical protein ACD_30C00049G0027 [uncultured bacterium]|uniref:Cysteine--tRNA ligase n=4 Tax=Candidatus Daviesiibacteriota TaxID=1752718 RepID=A0A0G0EYV1_9BACT|nr:MAG: hypothetical protein ACD_30C00049G0027 [uncultured bacterium]KKQ10677.1 MAG: Cysteine-tRNA ligase [Candidatus Daviesbacteria bacterium GW2011_GWB1_36_5]KKQ14999.1 MAG: Cysteine-tRNA ligase [Candidatus Daviesbacteria bacterium GW2011_GWA1_36_8]OGE16843.1 MAG: cysteine--tRNA ligase [Candidatus Daviesbacteria bacterium RIFCSPHIGHO2_01_FULL_36_37]OGE31201.1 MAG: cysteine--tRNA ligase [Candidatus Daviesbacteria bacterium RIFCSPHIGHO2_02_FULL_37_9]OGE35831.1 MAG: cysteine--tRNA ligase [Candi